MFEMLETGIGLDIILWLQENRTPWMAVLTQILDQLGDEIGYIAIFGIIFWAINKRHGIRLVFALVTIAIVTFALKDIFARPRPFMVSELVTPVFEADGFGIPSGHTSFAIMIWGYIGIWARKTWVWVLVVAYIILQMLGRMVAGVHFPQDIVLGVFVGIITLAIYYPNATRWGTVWNAQSLTIQIIIAIAVPLMLSLIVFVFPLEIEQLEAYLTLLGLAIGAGIGGAIESRYIHFEPSPKTPQRIGMVILGIVSTVLVLLGLSELFDLIAETGTLAYILRLVRYGLTGLVAIALVPMLGIRLNILQTHQPDQPAQATV